MKLNIILVATTSLIAGAAALALHGRHLNSSLSSQHPRQEKVLVEIIRDAALESFEISAMRLARELELILLATQVRFVRTVLPRE
jgi:hypothetical protein